MNSSALTNLEKQTAEFVTKLYESPDLPHYPYHNLQHTLGVVAHSREIATHYGLDAVDVFVVVVASWFHDIGHLYGPMPGHEERGVTIMREHLAHLPADVSAQLPAELSAELPADLLTAIGDCIMATKLPAHPVPLLHKIICDADTYHLGTPLFLQTDPLVRQEVEMRTGRTFPNWRQRTLDLLLQHHFFTDYCQGLLDAGKAKNIAWLREQIGG